MRRVLQILRRDRFRGRALGLYVAAMVGGLLAISALISANWAVASRRQGGQPLRLRWYVVASVDIAKDARIGADSVSRRFGLLPDDTAYISSVERVVGRYAADAIAANEIISSRELADSVSVPLPVDSVLVPVEVKPEHAASLRPGMQLAFVQGRQVIPPAANPGGGPTLAVGVTLLKVVDTRQGAPAVTLEVAVPTAEELWIGRLATGMWRPVIVSR